MRYFLATALMAFCSFAGGGGDAEAATATGTFNVQVTIAATCVLNSATNLNFGTQGVLAAPINDQSTITVTCTSSTPYNIGLDKGLNGGSVTTREMKGTLGAFINYSLFSNAPMTTNWGQTIGTDTVAATGTGSAQPFTVYGQIPAQPTPAPDTYNDTITVTVTY
ncbi:MAG: spore coat U domain-containing protein [Methylocella sp.]